MFRSLAAVLALMTATTLVQASSPSIQDGPFTRAGRSVDLKLAAVERWWAEGQEDDRLLHRPSTQLTGLGFVAWAAIIIWGTSRGEGSRSSPQDRR
jgi:hypothetical protein